MQENNRLFFQALLKNDLLGCVFVDSNLNVLDYNKLAGDEVQMIFGKEIQKGQNLLDFVFEKDRQNFLNHFNQCLAGEKITVEQEINQSADGLKHWFSVQFIPLVGEHGEVDAVCLATAKIDKQKQYLNKLQKNEKVYRLVADNASDVIWRMNDHLEFEYVSPSVEKVLGYFPEEVLNLGIREFCLPDDFERVMELANSEISQFMKGHGSGNREISIEIGLRNKKGKTIASEITARIFKDPSSKKGFYVEGITREVSHRKKMEKEIQRSQQKFADLISQISSIAVQGYKPDGTVVFWNKASENLYGYRAKEAIGRNLLDLIIPPQLREDVRQEIEKMTLTGEILDPEEQNLIRKNGTFVPVLSSYIVLNVGNGEKELYCLNVDLTRQKEAEKEWRKLSRVVEQSPDSIIITDTDGLIEYVNPQFFRSTGYAFDEVIGQSPGILSSGQTPPELYHDLWSTLRKGDVWNGEFINSKKNGELYYESAVVFPISEEGVVCHYASVKKDITKERQALKALRDSELKFRQLAENIDQIFWLHTNRKILYISTSFEKIFGIPISVIYKDPFSFLDVVIPEDLPLVKKMVQMEEAFSNEPFTFEFRIRRPDGTLRWIQTHTYPVPEIDGLKKRAGLSRDITERKQFEQDLVDAKMRAEKSDQLKEAFLRNISHEIRTPMNSILGFSELLSLGQLEEGKQEQYLETIVGSTNKLLEIVDDIMIISKLESGNLMLNPEMVDPVKVVDELFLKYCNSGTGLVLMEKEICPGVPPVWVDRARLLSILEKLIVNALKFTYKGSIKIGFKCLDDGIRFFINDTGIGIEKGNQSIIFEPFRQLDAKVNRRFEGNGLGLTIASRTAHVMNTQIKVDSEPCKGSCFYFDLKYTRQTGGMELPGERKQSFKDKVKLLIVDDEEHNAFFLSELVQSIYPIIEFDISFAKNGKQAVVKCAKPESFDLILMDIRMPEMNGLEATDQIKKIKPNVPVIAQTALVSEEDFKRIQNAGIDACICKPIWRDKLKGVLDRFLKKSTD
ncbi:hybrid sensor histidine kinase/response regulator [Marinilabilia rubra]|uniref:histidine kinase n=1 Tax=Marinilabilia rubra TaxID=2162893 RepID=A0A2U2BA29_9BACT|nr:PAS domain S-box protein [Marinilabilia rubra]PWD99893.1 hypothetical protein DDZ16_08365 [Marinilabilia rubra]